MKKTLIFLVLFLPLLVFGADGIKTKDEAVRMAEKGLGYLEKGDYQRALLVPIEGTSGYKEVAQDFSQGAGKDKVEALEKAFDIVKGTIREGAVRQLVFVKRTGFPFYFSPSYKVLFASRVKGGVLKEQVVLQYLADSRPGRSRFLASYDFRFIPDSGER